MKVDITQNQMMEGQEPFKSAIPLDLEPIFCIPPASLCVSKIGVCLPQKGPGESQYNQELHLLIILDTILEVLSRRLPVPFGVKQNAVVEFHKS